MTYGAGSLAITARRVRARTIIERVRYDGISRCSRAFPDGDAALIVLSQLGPGVVRGDSVVATGEIRADAHLIVTNQTATRLMGGPRPSYSRAHWKLAENAVLELVGEPLIATADARYEATTLIELQAAAHVEISELACVPAGAAVRLRTTVRRGGREMFYDAFDAAAAAPQTVGTLAIVGIESDRITPLVAALDRVADTAVHVRLGVGVLRDGALVRLVANDIWTVRSTLAALRAAVRTVLSNRQRAGGVTPAVGSSSSAGLAESSCRIDET